MTNYDPKRAEKTTRANLVKGVWQELKDGRGPCYMDATGLNWDEFLASEPHVVMRLCGMVDPQKSRFEWVPAVHSFLGGIKINEKSQTSLKGLFVSGEAATGMHGANRLAGNALSDCFVMGQRSGKYAAHYARNNKPRKIKSKQIQSEIERIESIRNKKGEDPYKVEKEIRDFAWSSIGIIRSAKGLKSAMDYFTQIEKLNFKINTLKELVKTLEVKNLALTGLLVARAGLKRNESCGQHIRENSINFNL